MHMASTGTSWDARPLMDRTIKDLELARVRRYMMLTTNVGRRNFASGDRPRDILEKLETAGQLTKQQQGIKQLSIKFCARSAGFYCKYFLIMIMLAKGDRVIMG